MIVYKEMSRSQLHECAVIAAKAFYDYEYFSIYIPEDKKRQRFLDQLLKCEFKANEGLDSVKFLVSMEDDKILAVAQLCSPDFVKPSDWTYIKAGWLKVVSKGGSKSVAAWQDMEKEASAPCHSCNGKTWYISLLTVDKSTEGKGVGSRFLSECIIPFVKEQGAESLCLFTNSEINRKFYLKNGFEEFDEKHFVYNGESIGSWSYLMKF